MKNIKALPVVMALVVAPLANAETYTFGSNSTIVQINTALEAAASNSEHDTVNLPAGTITGNLVIPIAEDNYSITIAGNSDDPEDPTVLEGDDGIAISMANEFSDELSSSAPTLIVKNLTIQNSTGAIIAEGANLEIDNIILSDNQGSGDASAFFSHLGTLTWRGIVRAVTIDANEVTATGNSNSPYGGVLFSSSSLTVTDSAFTDNESGVSGGAIHNECYALGDIVLQTTVEDSEFDSNTSGIAGGAVFSKACLDTTITGSTFTDNSVTSGYGGAVLLRTVESILVSDSDFFYNTANVAAGTSISLCVDGSEERKYCLGDGGAVRVDNYYGADVTIEGGSNFIGNKAEGVGGAISLTGACTDSSYGDTCAEYTDQTDFVQYNISDATFSGNEAGYFDSEALYMSEGPVIGTSRYTYGEIASATNVDFTDDGIYVVSEHSTADTSSSSGPGGGGSTSLFSLFLLALLASVRGGYKSRQS